MLTANITALFLKHTSINHGNEKTKYFTLVSSELVGGVREVSTLAHSLSKQQEIDMILSLTISVLSTEL